MLLPHPAIDLEVKTLTDMLALGKWLPHEVVGIQHQIRDRRAQVEAGSLHPSSAYWTPKLQSIDPRLRLRWDFKAGWVIDRAVSEWGCWAICATLGFRYIPENLLDILRAGDMQRVGAEKWLEQKREKAQGVQDANEKRSADAVLGAVDKLSDKRIKEFIAVERAVQTGETIVAHGQTERSLDRMRQASFHAQQESDLHDDSQDMNISDHPLMQKRTTGGKHVRES
jgi:hypothetical protein